MERRGKVLFLLWLALAVGLGLSALKAQAQPFVMPAGDRPDASQGEVLEWADEGLTFPLKLNCNGATYVAAYGILPQGTALEPFCSADGIVVYAKDSEASKRPETVFIFDGKNFVIFVREDASRNIEPQTTEKAATLHVAVVEKNMGKPIEGAIVYLGRGEPKSSTDSEGKCVLEDLVYGNYGLNVFKKGYYRYSKNTYFEKGDNILTVELEKKAVPPAEVTLVGTVREVITAEGTRSEDHFLKIRDDLGNEEYLFNEIGENTGFEEFVNDRVKVSGFREKGFIGWRHEQVDGIYVENIEPVAQR